MKKLILLAAAAAFMSPVLSSSASAQSVSVRVGDPGYSAYSQQRTVTKKVVVGTNCRTTTVRTKRANGTIWVRKVRKCS